MIRALVLVALLPGAATAQQIDCDGAVTQRELNACAERDWQDADQALNALWGQAKAHAQRLDAGLPARQRGIWQALLDGQRAWLVFRDRTCEAEGGPMRGGSAEALLVYACLARLTRERADGLRIFLADGGM